MPNIKKIQQGDTTNLKISSQRVDLLQISPHLQGTTQCNKSKQKEEHITIIIHMTYIKYSE